MNLLKGICFGTVLIVRFSRSSPRETPSDILISRIKEGLKILRDHSFHYVIDLVRLGLGQKQTGKGEQISDT